MQSRHYSVLKTKLKKCITSDHEINKQTTRERVCQKVYKKSVLVRSSTPTQVPTKRTKSLFHSVRNYDLQNERVMKKPGPLHDQIARPFLAVLEQQKILETRQKYALQSRRFSFNIETQGKGKCIAAEKKAPSSHANPICEQQSTRQKTRMRRARICQTCSSEPLSALEQRMNIQRKTGGHPSRQ